MTNTNQTHCECGEVFGERCAWTGPVEETVLIEYMPESFRASHRAANNSGTYPANGAERIRVSLACAEVIMESEGEWAEKVGA